MTASVIAQVVMVLTLLLMITGKTPIYMTAIVGATLSALIAGFPIMGSAEMTIAKMVNTGLNPVIAVMRRAHTSEEHNAQREYRNGPMRLSESSRSLWINDREVKLADSEYHLMLALMKHPGSVISHEHLLQRVWGGHSIGDVQNLRVAFSRIRRKLEENGIQGGVISAYSGVGYLLRDLVRDPLL